MFLVSFLFLFLELVVIRWLSAEVPIFAYFKNFPLLAAFLGLGLGCALADYRRDLVILAPFAFSLLFIIIIFAEQLELHQIVFPEKYIFAWGRTSESWSPGEVWRSIHHLAVIFSVFLLVMFSFACLGQRLGKLIRTGEALVAYSVDIAGSLTGIVLFSILSFLQLPPFVWLSTGYLILFILIRKSFRFLRIPTLICFLIVILLASLIASERPLLWSPYYRIEISNFMVKKADRYIPAGKLISVNRDMHQTLYDLSDEMAEVLPDFVNSRRLEYYLPYIISRNYDSVLIVGAGAGNDAAAAVKYKARVIDAVEIDPVIADLGKSLHPDKPNLAPNVNLIIDDARSYFKKAKKKYDLIVFSILDSHTALSSLSSLRLDNFVYTTESIKEVYSLLKPKGLVVLSFHEWGHEWIGERLFRVCQEAIGKDIIAAKYRGRIYIIFGKNTNYDLINQRLASLRLERPTEVYSESKIKVTTDDWPFLYAHPNGQPVVYYFALLLIAIIALVLVRVVSKPDSSETQVKFKMDWQMFFLGVSFLLLETTSLTRTALLLGSTWLVNAFVFAGILIMILLANLLVLRFRINKLLISYIFLWGSLVFVYLFPLDVLNLLSFGARGVLGSMIVALPLLFAGIVFAISFAQVRDASFALGSNLLGAVLGGILEALSLSVGIKNLLLLALVSYILSYLFIKLKRPLLDKTDFVES